MTHQKIFDTIAEHWLFRELEHEDLKCLAEAAREMKYPRNALVFNMYHRKTRHFFLILEGSFQLHLQNLKKKTMYPGEVFGEVAFFSNDHRTGSVRAMEKSKVLAFPRSVFTEPTHLSAHARVHILQLLTGQIIGYLSNYLQRSTATLARKAESAQLEFKVSYQEEDWEKLKIVQTVAAMVNADGGSILLGVNDNGKVVGLEKRSSSEVDKMVNRLLGYIDHKLGKDCCDLVDVYGDEIGNKQVLRIDCSPSAVPVFAPAGSAKRETFHKLEKVGGLEEVGYMFFRRSGPRNVKLKNGDIAPYLKRRFLQQPAAQKAMP